MFFSGKKFVYKVFIAISKEDEDVLCTWAWEIGSNPPVRNRSREVLLTGDCTLEGPKKK
jgi:hypothetical protein